MTTSISTIVGELFISGNESFITEVTLEKKELTGTNPLLDSAKSQLSEYFEARRKVFDLPLDLSKLTSFQKKVLQCCAKIPYGKGIDYTDHPTKNALAIRRHRQRKSKAYITGTT